MSALKKEPFQKDRLVFQSAFFRGDKVGPELSFSNGIIFPLEMAENKWATGIFLTPINGVISPTYNWFSRAHLQKVN